MQTVSFKHLPLKPGDTVLDLGCGEGRHVILAYLEQQVTAIGVDLCLKDLRSAQQKFEPFYEPDNAGKSFGLSAANALQLPFADNTFDKVICSEVLEHIPDYAGALVEIERVLKPGGLFCASVPRRWPEKICWFFSDAYHQVEGGHIRIFAARALKEQIEALGFKTFQQHWAHALHSPFWWLKCIFWDSQETNWFIKQYHRFLVWDLMARPLLTRTLEAILNPILGKSVVMYFRKEATGGSV
jgi:ubiquinone/menaquinone biosynthesis C-methylase UbiE